VCSTPLLAAAVAIAAALAPAPAAGADDAFVCLEDTQEKCDWENKNLELFVKAHDAFDRGREKGDLTEARNYALELISRKDERHGKAIMKYVYMQVGMGVHRNYVEAYRWLSSDLASGAKYARLDLERTRDRLAAKMTPEQLAEARR
jgi:hypothetical protein